MKSIKTASYKNLVQAQFENIRTPEDFAAMQEAAISQEVKDYVLERISENPSISSQDLYMDVKYNFIDDKDYDTAPEYASTTERVIKLVIDKMEEQRHQAEDEDSQAAYEAEMGRDTYKQYGDGYQVEDTSPCKDPNDRLRSNGKGRSQQDYDNVEKTNYYSPIV